MFFKYRAINKDGKIFSGKINVENKKVLITYLKQRGLTPFKIQKVDASKSLLGFLFNRISFNDIVSFTRQIAIMLNAGLTLIDSLEILKKQLQKPKMIELVKDIDEEIKSGSTFSSALKKYPEYFPNLYIALIKSGEASGKLSEIMIKLSDNLEKSQQFKSKIKGAMMYPMIVVMAMFGVMFVMITFVVPKLLGLYKDFNMKLPMSTRILIALSDISIKFWPIIVGGTLLSFYAIKKFAKTPDGKRFIDSNMLKIPIINNVIVMSSLVNSTRTLSILVSSGISILEALSIVIETTGNIVYQDAFKNVYTQVEKGISMGRAMMNEGIFPPILIQMTMVGEQTGHLDETMGRISAYFQSESEIAIKMLTTLIEPAILLFLGAGVGFLVLAVITPIYNITAAF